MDRTGSGFTSAATTRPDAPSARQERILELVRKGLPSKEIAAVLGVSEQSAKQHVSSLMRRFGAPNRAVLAEIATVRALMGEAAEAPVWLRYLFAEAPVLIAVRRGPTHICVAANHLYRRLVGDRPIIGRGLRDAFPEPAMAKMLERADTVYATGKPSIWRAVPLILGRDPSTSVIYLDSMLHPIRDDSGTVSGLVYFGTDVTELVERQREVELLVAQRSALADAADDGLVIIDGDGRRLLANGAAERMGFGAFEDRPAAERIAVYRLRDPRTGEPLTVGPSTRAIAGETIDGELVLLRVPGRDRDTLLQIWGWPIRDDRGQVAGALLRFRERVDLAATLAGA